MKLPLSSISSATRASHVRLFRSLAVLICAGALSGALLGQDDVAPTAKSSETKAEKKAARRENNLIAQADPAVDPNARRRQRGQDGADTANGARGNFDPAQMQERMLTALRTQFDVTDDAEWKLISDRIIAVSEIRRASGGGFAGMMGSRGGSTGSPSGNRGSRGGNPEADALRQAIQDKLPEAEIKSRLTRLRESRKTNEEKLQKVQEDLRAVLSVRQEAVAVMAGLLP
jgi:hypothetical protein